MKVRLMRIYMERFFTRKVIIGLTLLCIIAIHFMVHFHEDEGISKNESIEIEAAKNYDKPKVEKVAILKEPDFNTIKQGFSPENEIVVVFLVEQSEGSRFRKQTSEVMKKSTDSFLFIQISSTVDDPTDENTFFIQPSNYYNPWAVIIEHLHGKLVRFVENSKHVLFVSSKTHVNYPLFPVFQSIFQTRAHSSVWSAPREDYKVERNPEKHNFVPSFLYKPQNYPDESFNDGFIVLSSTTFKSIDSSSSQNSFFPLGVYFYNELAARLESESLKPPLTRFLPKNIVLLRSEVSSDLCKMNSTFLTTDFENQKEIEDLKASAPEHGYRCIPYINYQVNNIIVVIAAIFVGGCSCCQCLGGLIAFVVTPPKKKQWQK